MGEHQRVFHRERRVVATATSSRSILAGRARQVIRLHGYRMGFTLAFDSPVSGDTTVYQMMLQAINRDWGLVPFDFSPANSISTLGASSVIDYVLIDAEETIVTNGNLGHSYQYNEWINCNILVPEVAVYTSILVNDNMGLNQWVVLEYEWEDADLAKIAAVNFAWGRDPGDFDRS